MTELQFLHPRGWPRSSGYSEGVLGHGRVLFIAGQIGWDPLEKSFASAVLADQVRQALRNVVAVLAEADGEPKHIARMTWYLTSREEYLAQLTEIGIAYRAVLGKHFPAMTAVQVVACIEPQAKVEIEATAVIPSK